MATYRANILTNLRYDAGVFPYPFDQYATNDVWKHQVIVMVDDDTNKLGFHGSFEVQDNFGGSVASIEVIYTAQVITGDIIFDFDYRAVGGSDTESLDQTGVQEAATTSALPAPSAANERMVAEIPLTASNFAPNDTVQYYFTVDGANASCTISDVLQLIKLKFKYTDA